MKTRVFALISCLAFATLIALGQGGTGTITGTVTDAQGAVVAGASVEVKNSATGQTYAGASSGTGNFSVGQLPPGEYELTVKNQGFKTYDHKNLQVETGQVLRQDAQLEVGATGESVTVTAEATMLRTESGDLAVNITVQSLDNLPILGIGTTNSGSSGVRNPYNMLQMLPGVGNYTANSEMMLNGLGGAAYTTEAFRIEGQDATNHLGTGYAVQENQPSADAIQEVAIQTSNYAPEFGTAGAAVLNVTMKSGTNQFHGSAYDYFVNEDLNAGYPFSITNQGQIGKLRPRNRRNDFGGTFGGPVWIPKVYNGRNKTFFFFNWEEYLESNFYTFSDTVPQAFMTNGDFSSLSPNGTCSLCGQYGIPTGALGTPTAAKDPLGRSLFANTIYDPASRVVVNGSGTATPFLNNQVPSSRFDPVAVKFESLFPQAQNANLTGDYAGTILGHRTTAIPAIKVDESATPKDKFSFYFSKTGTEAQFAYPFGNADGLPPEIGAYRGTFIYAWTYRLNYDRTINPTLLLHLGVGFEQVNFGDHAPFLSFNPSQFGRSGFEIDRQFPYVTGMTAAGTNGAQNFGGMQNIGTVAQIQTFNKEQRPSYNANLTKVSGSHTYKFGGEASFQGNNLNSFAGVTLATGVNPTTQPYVNTTSLNGFGTGLGYASFLLGNYTSTTQTPQEDYRLGKAQWAFFAQDSWKLTRKLTLDYGLRYDLGTPTKETYNRLGEFSPTTPNPSAGGRLGATVFGNTCNCAFYAPVYPYAIGPRIGIAYQINPKTVFRAGWGVVYQYTPDNASAGIVATNAVNTNPAVVNGFVNTQQAGFIQQPVWPNTNTGVYPNPGTTTGAPFASDPNFYRPPRLNQWSVGIQREITRNFVVEASYVGNRQVWVPIGGAGTGPYAYLNQIAPSTYAQYGLYPYPGTGPCSTGGSVCSSSSYNNYSDYLLLAQPISNPSVMAKMKAAGVGNGGLLLPYATAPVTMPLSTALQNFPQFPNLTPSGSPTGDERYDSLQAKVTKRLSHNLQAGGAFTWQKTFLRAPRQDFFNPASSQWELQNVPPRVLTFNFVYTTPKVSSFDNHAKFVNQIIKDWQIGGFADYQSGTFLTPPFSNTSNFLASEEVRVPGQPLYLKNINCLSCYNPENDQVLNPAAWTNLSTNQVGPAQTVLYEDFRGPRRPIENANIARNFRLTERFQLQFRGEFVNIFNRTELPNPIAGGSTVFGGTNSTTPLVRNSVSALTGGFGVIPVYAAPGSTLASTSAANGGVALSPRSGTLVLRLTW